MIDHATLAKSLASAEANVASLIARAAGLAGKPTEHDALILVDAAQRITANLRKLLATTDRREGTS